jgi:hypothetical protein
MPLISRRRPLDHGRRPIDGGNPAGFQPVADQRDGNAAAAADLQQAIVRLDGEPLNSPQEARRDVFGHGGRS